MPEFDTLYVQLESPDEIDYCQKKWPGSVSQISQRIVMNQDVLNYMCDYHNFDKPVYETMSWYRPRHESSTTVYWVIHNGNRDQGFAILAHHDNSLPGAKDVLESTIGIMINTYLLYHRKPSVVVTAVEELVDQMREMQDIDTLETILKR